MIVVFRGKNSPSNQMMEWVNPGFPSRILFVGPPDNGEYGDGNISISSENNRFIEDVKKTVSIINSDLQNYLNVNNYSKLIAVGYSQGAHIALANPMFDVFVTAAGYLPEMLVNPKNKKYYMAYGNKDKLIPHTKGDQLSGEISLAGGDVQFITVTSGNHDLNSGLGDEIDILLDIL